MTTPPPMKPDQSALAYSDQPELKPNEQPPVLTVSGGAGQKRRVKDLKYAIYRKKLERTKPTSKMTPEQRKRRNARMREYNKRPEVKAKQRVYQHVKAAIKNGTLIKKTCERCPSQQSEAHHNDYSKPLEVIWLCRYCHCKEHKLSPFFGNPLYDSA